MWESASPPSGWSVYSNAQDKFILGAGGSGRGPGYADACALGHFHSGTTQTGNAQISPSSHGHQVRMSNDTGDISNFESAGGFVLDEGPLQTYGANSAASGDARGTQIGGQTISDSGHTHTINTWGILYDNTSFPGGTGSWTAIGGDNVSTQSAVTNRNIPPYISLYFIKKS